LKTILKPKSERDSWREEAVVAQKRTTDKMSGSHYCPELGEPSVRLGADDHMEWPSRRGSHLVYRDGRQERIS